MKTKTTTPKIPAADNQGRVDWTFDTEFAHMFRLRENQFNEAKAKFIKEAETNPAYAIKWADSLMTQQYIYECWIICQKHLASVGKEDGFATKRDAVQACCDYIMADVMMSIGGGQSTCLLSRCDHTCKQVGYKRGLEDIRPLLRSDLIDG